MSLQGVGLGVDIFTRCPETDCDSHMQVRDLGLSFRSISERFLRLFNTSRTPASIREKWRNMVGRHPHYAAPASPGAPSQLFLSLSLFQICLLAVVAVFLLLLAVGRSVGTLCLVLREGPRVSGQGSVAA